jgi:hypothetical protein
MLDTKQTTMWALANWLVAHNDPVYNSLIMSFEFVFVHSYVLLKSDDKKNDFFDTIGFEKASSRLVQDRRRYMVWAPKASLT